MKNTFRIYKRDLKNIFTNWVALVVVLALVILPPLYAWFNIKASWDPYGNTKGIKVAVVNKDEGGTFGDKNYEIGDMIINSLKENNQIGWQFVSEKEAKEKVENGEYYASIVIPKNFTKDVLSITSDSIEKPKLLYTVNEKTNAIAPKITDKGASSIQSQVSSQIVKTIDGIIFKALNQVGIEVKNAKPQIRSAVDKLYQINDNMPQIYDLLQKADNGIITVEELVDKVNRLMPTIEDTINETQDLLNSFQDYLQKGNEAFQQISPTIKNDLTIINGITGNVSNIVNSVDLNGTQEEIKLGLNNSKEKFQSLSTSIEDVNNFILNINKVFNNEKLTNLSNNLIAAKEKVDGGISLIDTIISGIDSGSNVALEKFNDIKTVVNDVNNIITGINNRYDSEIVPAIESGVTSLNTISTNSLNILNEVEGSLPDVKNVISLIESGAELGNEKLTDLINNFPNIQAKLGDLVNKIKNVDDENLINGLLDLLINDWQSSSSFLASPVELETASLFPIPNYGSGMNPFFTTLSLWVGALLLVSLLTSNAKKLSDDEEIGPLQEYFGKYLTFLTIGILQGLVVTLGDIFILDVYVVHPVLFVFYGMFISIVFVTIVYTLVSLFGNIGKALGVVFLVLQISASGGTFPIQVMPEFFQKIHPLLPFKYGIGGMREAVAGIVPELLIKDTVMLVIYMMVFLILGIILKKFVNKMLSGFNKKLDESGLLGH